MALGPDQTKLWHPLGAPDAFPPHAGGLLGPKRVLDILSWPSANPNPVAEILVARPPKKPFRHPTEAVPIPHITTRALPTPMPTATVHIRTVHGRPRAAGAERVLGMLPSVSQAFLPPKTPNFDQISPKRGPKSPHGGLGRPPEPERGPPASTRAAPTRAGAWVGRRAYKYGALVGCTGGLFQGFRRIGGAASGAPDSPWHPTGAVPIPHTTNGSTFPLGFGAYVAH